MLRIPHLHVFSAGLSRFAVEPNILHLILHTIVLSAIGPGEFISFNMWQLFHSNVSLDSSQSASLL